MTSGYAFSPKGLSVKVGDRVRVKDGDADHHTWTDSGVFDSGDLGPGQTFSYRFMKAGTFSFVCSYHDTLGMRGTVTVS